MKWNKKWSLLLLFGALVISSCVTSNTKTKTLNLLVTFGSSYPGPQLTFKNIHNTALEHFGGEEIKWAYTSKFILRKLRKGNGEGALNGKVFDIYSPTEALEKAAEEGYSSIYIQSLHIIPGEEFDELKAAVKAFEKKHKGIHVKVGTPLLNNDEDIKAVAQVLANKFATQVAEGPVFFMGHGTPHQADAQYNKLQAELTKLNENFFVGTVEGIGFGQEENEGKGPMAIGSLVSKINAISPKPIRVTITPLMSVAGDHANNDMNGKTNASNPLEQSWRERLEAEGFVVTDIMKGLGDYDEINAIWMNHLKAIK